MVYKNGKKVIYVEVLRTINAMLIAALLFYQQFMHDLESIGFLFNRYDPCIASRYVNGKQPAIRFHVDDLMSSHKDKKAKDGFAHACSPRVVGPTTTPGSEASPTEALPVWPSSPAT